MLTIETAKAYAAATLTEHGSKAEMTGRAWRDAECTEVVQVEIIWRDSGYSRLATFDVWNENGKHYGEY